MHYAAFIWVLTFCKSTRLVVSRRQGFQSKEGNSLFLSKMIAEHEPQSENFGSNRESSLGAIPNGANWQDHGAKTDTMRL